MRHRRPTPASSGDSDKSDNESCFDTEDEEEKTDANTDPTDVDTDVNEAEDIEVSDEADLAWIVGDENVYPPKYYLDQEDDFNESEDEDEDYSDNSILLLDMIEALFHRYCKYTRKDPARTIEAISLRALKAFFDWILNQRRGKGGRRLAGIKSAHTLGTYWKVFRLVCERATGVKIKGKMNRIMHRVLRKLAKKHGLTKEKREKTAMYIEDVVGVLQTNLTTTKKSYTHGRHRIQIALFHHLAAFSGNRPSALLNLRYRHIVVTLLRDPTDEAHRILIEFTCEFKKQYLGMKDKNTFPLPEIIFDPSLILSPHVALLGLNFADQAFMAPNLTSAENISKLDIRPGYEQLPLHLKPELANIPIFRKSVKTLYSWEISPDQQLPYSTLLSWMKKLGVLTGFPQITHPYGLRYAAGNAFNQSGDVSDALQNLMLQHANMDTFIKHYLPRRVTADTRAIVSGYAPQHDLMRAACRMTRWIDPNRPQELTSEQSFSINQDPHICRLVEQREKWKHRSQGTATRQPRYRILSREIFNARQRLRSALLREVQTRWDLEHPVNEVELQLAGLKFDQEVKTTLDQDVGMPPIQKRLVETMMTLPGTTLEAEIGRRNAAINAVAAYCEFQEGGAAVVRSRKRLTQKRASVASTKETNAQCEVNEAEKQALTAAMLSVFKDKRPTFCFICLGEESLLFEMRIKSFASPGDLTKHFKRKHLSNLQEAERIGCKVCRMSLQHKQHLQNHAASIHGTIS